jgi:hypothetical protein
MVLLPIDEICVFVRFFSVLATGFPDEEIAALALGGVLRAIGIAP